MTQLKTPALKAAFPKTSPLVSVLIPAKNEERNIRACVESLKNQNYPNTELILINDNSSDATESIFKEMNVPYINCPLPPEGWTGKNHALFYGSPKAKGDWLLFTDADTRHAPHSIASALAHAENHHLDFLSLLPHCLTGSLSEKIFQPSAMAYLGLWFPFERVNDPASPLYFANGQYLLIRRSLYEQIGGHQAVAKEFLEDFALMRLSKQSGAKAECSFGTEIYGTRMYETFDAIWRGWRRIYLHAFERNAFPLIKNALSLFLFSFLPFFFPALILSLPLRDSLAPSSLGLPPPITTPLILSVLLVVWILGIAWGAHKIVKAKSVYAIFQPVAAFILTLILLDAARMALLKTKTQWR